MSSKLVKIQWPNGVTSLSKIGNLWLEEARANGITIPTGCLKGSCGACEIEVNGKVVRACISKINNDIEEKIKVELYYDPYW